MTRQSYPCAIAGCVDLHVARGWCHRHWERWRRYGDPLGGGPDRGKRQPGPFPSDAELRRLAREYVNQVRQRTPCAKCGGPMRDWHSFEHVVRPIRRISRMVGIGCTVRIIALEIARCTPLCRRCHMIEDGRMETFRRVNTKLTAAQVVEIRSLAHSSTRAELSARFGVKASVIGKIVLRQLWAAV